jgi:hypothetical protein
MLGAAPPPAKDFTNQCHQVRLNAVFKNTSFFKNTTH